MKAVALCLTQSRPTINIYFLSSPPLLNSLQNPPSKEFLERDEVLKSLEEAKINLSGRTKEGFLEEAAPDLAQAA